MEYEFYLHFWGEIMNDNLVEKKLGIKGDCFWFPTNKERENFKKKLYDFAKDRGVTIVFSKAEGFNVRKKTIATMIFEHEGKEYPFGYDFGYGNTLESSEYIFAEGNYSCDCNRSILLRREYPDFPEMECGDTINMVRFNIALL